MKRILAIIITAVMLTTGFAFAEQADVYTVGPYSYDASGSEEVTNEAEQSYILVDYGSYVVTVEYFDLGSAGFDNAYFADRMDDPTTANIIDLLLSLKYNPDSEDLIHQWYEIESNDTSDFNPEGKLYNGQLIDSLGGGYMAGLALYDDGGLLLYEFLSFDDYTVEEMQALRDEHIGDLTLNGQSVTAKTTGSIIPSVNPFAGLIVGNNQDEAEAYEPKETDVVFGSFTYDTEGCDEYSVEGNYLFVDYGDEVVIMEYGTFEDNGYSFQYFSDLYGGDMTTADMAGLLFDYSDYCDTESETYNVCVREDGVTGTDPDGIFFNGTVKSDFSGGIITGAVLVTETEIIFYECISFDNTDTLGEMQAFREESLGNLRYNGVPVK